MFDSVFVPKRIGIIGSGLIGGSMALAIRENFPYIFLAVSSNNLDELKELFDRNIADLIHENPISILDDLDYLIVSTPIEVMENIAKTIAPFLDKNTLVTDVGSVKLSIVQKLSFILPNNFVGSHPMTGNEHSGLKAAQRDLFRQKACFVTITTHVSDFIVKKVTYLWEALGSTVYLTTPAEHDRIVAYLSHLPHAIAYALVHLIQKSFSPDVLQTAGGSFRDATRVAKSNPSMWTKIFKENKKEVFHAIAEMSEILNTLNKHIENNDYDTLEKIFTFASQSCILYSTPIIQDINN